MSDRHEELRQQRARRVARAERRTGYTEGPFIWRGQQARVEVSFYPTEKWWLVPRDGERQALTPDLWAECTKLRL